MGQELVSKIKVHYLQKIKKIKDLKERSRVLRKISKLFKLKNLFQQRESIQINLRRSSILDFHLLVINQVQQHQKLSKLNQYLSI